MNPADIIQNMRSNADAFKALFSFCPERAWHWKAKEEDWSLIEILCHLVDEEREDFRTRLKYVLKDPALKWPPIDPRGWVKSRNYAEQNPQKKLVEFLSERAKSLHWLESLQNPNWKAAHIHSQIGPMSAEFIFSNWLAHDYLHIRQIVRVKWNMHAQNSDPLPLLYAGEW